MQLSIDAAVDSDSSESRCGEHEHIRFATKATLRTDEEIMNTSNPHTNRTSPSLGFRLPLATKTHGACDYYSKDNGFPIRSPSSFSYVCCHWRNVALNCSTLSTYLFVVSPRWMQGLLSGSKRAPLKLCLIVPLWDQAPPALTF